MRSNCRIVLLPHLRSILPVSPPPHRYCDLHTAGPHGQDGASSVVESLGERRQQELREHYNAARQNRLDIMSAARILFSTAEKPNKFGWDFHLWQFFVACLPPLAVYLCAQWIRSDMRKMEKERERAKEERQKKANILTGQHDVRNEEEGSELAGTSVNSSKFPEGTFTLRARLDAIEEKIRRMELTSQEISKDIRRETAPNSKMEDQRISVSASMGLATDAQADKQNEVSRNVQHGINTTSQEEVNFQVSSRKNEDQKK